PTHVTYRGLDVYGAAPPSSGGSTVGEALNILGNFKLSALDRVRALSYYLEASKLAYADRAVYLADPAYADVPLGRLLSPDFARTRACLINPDKAATAPVTPGPLTGAACPPATTGGGTLAYEGPQTTNLVTADRWGDIAEYTLTIEQFGGSAL